MTSLDGLKQRLHEAVKEKDIAAFSSLAFSYAGMLPLCSPEIVSLCVKDYFLAFFQEGSFSKEPSVFEELFSRFLAHMKASEEQKYDWNTILICSYSLLNLQLMPNVMSVGIHSSKKSMLLML